MNYLKHDDYVPIGLNLKLGQTVNIVHCKSSSGGRDEACYITKRNDGVVVAFCHRCGAKGKYTPMDNTESVESIIQKAEDFIKSNVSYGEVLVEDKEKIVLPLTLSGHVRHWPPEARAWLLKYGITSSEIARHSIEYCFKLRRILFPIYNKIGLLEGYVSRKIFSDDKYPKYLIHKREGTRIYKHVISPPSAIPFQCVFTEDIVSAIRCGRFMDSYAMLGVNMPSGILKDMQHYNTVFIFLDNDNDTVRKKQLELKQTLLSFVHNVHIIEASKDPKEHTDEELKEIFTKDYDGRF